MGGLRIPSRFRCALSVVCAIPFLLMLYAPPIATEHAASNDKDASVIFSNLLDTHNALCDGAELTDSDVLLKMLEKAVHQHAQHLNASVNWSPQSSSHSWEAFTSSGSDKQYVPFVRRVEVPAMARVVLWGDVHGSACSLLSSLVDLHHQGFVDAEFSLAEDVYFAFLGDVVDRGENSVEAVGVIVRMFLANPSQVFYIRGNHEDRLLMSRFGAEEEVRRKFTCGGCADRALEALGGLFRHLPAAVYLGRRGPDEVDWLQLSHGSSEIGYNPKKFLAEPSGVSFERVTVNRTRGFHDLQAWAKSNNEYLHNMLENDLQYSIAVGEASFAGPMRSPRDPVTLGLAWHDVYLPETVDMWGISEVNGRGLAYGGYAMHALVALASSPNVHLRGVMRAHQHHNAIGRMHELLLSREGLVNHASIPLISTVMMGDRLDESDTHYPTESSWTADDTLFCTLLSAPQSNLRFGADSYGVLTVGETFEQWTLHHHWREHTRKIPTELFGSKQVHPLLENNER